MKSLSCPMFCYADITPLAQFSSIQKLKNPKFPILLKLKEATTDDLDTLNIYSRHFLENLFMQLLKLVTLKLINNSTNKIQKESLTSFHFILQAVQIN